MVDTEIDRCGICPFTFGGWMLPACKWHDAAYIKGSWAQENLSREYVDKVFYSQLLVLASRGTFQAGKRIQAWVAYKFVRNFGSAWWEGEEYGEPSLDQRQVVAAVLSRETQLPMSSAFV